MIDAMVLKTSSESPSPNTAIFIVLDGIIKIFLTFFNFFVIKLLFWL